MNPIFLQRISYALRKLPIIPKLITYFIRLVFGCYLPYSIKLGKKFVLGYGGLGIVIHARTIVGDDVHIDQNVTIGGTSKKYEVPKLGNSVYVGAGAAIIGPVTIGNNVVIGANAVVVKDIPDGCLVVGVPAKIIKENIKKSDYV
ncbi:serine acetyltransferase [Tenacibaculum singaporense]|uniref:Serine acetyltransferase n=1 Tax=Tenacibaculum singaporense TaxID=2358479 RepID=A0A3Q8RSU9_9FLAO|nr:serine acetyltransferase [Tenacibaculum singaporense]AZJ35035.1 serine acetyltransferase [Tenacibaculum singaporense]